MPTALNNPILLRKTYRLVSLTRWAGCAQLKGSLVENGGSSNKKTFGQGLSKLVQPRIWSESDAIRATMALMEQTIRMVGEESEGLVARPRVLLAKTGVLITVGGSDKAMAVLHGRTSGQQWLSWLHQDVYGRGKEVEVGRKKKDAGEKEKWIAIIKKNHLICIFDCL